MQFNDEIMIDLDETNVAVGIEVLEEGPAYPSTTWWIGFMSALRSWTCS